MRIVGIDAGGSKTFCQVAGADLVVQGEARAEGSNLATGGAGDTEAVLRDVVQRALGGASAVDAVCIGMAGVDRPHEAAVVREIAARLVEVPADRVLVVNDALIALEAGAPGGGPGVVLISGTGSIAYGRDGHGRAARAGGWGAVLGDEGSGYWLGRQALRTVMRASDGRGPATTLAPLVFAHYGIEDARGLVDRIYYGDARPSAIAALGTLVGDAARQGDASAQRLVDIAAADLADAAHFVATKLGLRASPVVLAGGVFQAVPEMTAAVAAALARVSADLTVRSLDVEPVRGALHLARALTRGPVVVPTYV
jgi:N-acetylglucosamine kinase-like BadF-type ATPase